ncbi:type I-E CRISPR-associated protein Cas7/Cse4/CasC [Candidimonas nitroreducens]|nr:type I-E CRISPR-associated protein Cas7/Cse4/CasC [Candidimonas nitroreducens]
MQNPIEGVSAAMSQFLEFHVIQNFAPSNLNRDDTGAPKDAMFGGYRRARISSQCQKRAVREYVRINELLPAENQGIRTKRLKKLLLEKLVGRDEQEASVRIGAALAAVGLTLKDDSTQYLLFLGAGEIAAMAELIERHWDVLGVAADSADANPAKEAAKKSKKDAKASIPAELQKQAKAIFDGAKAVDVALFGRMLADLPAVNQDASCQVAHAISTHQVEREFDYFTAVDEVAYEDAGAGMIGQVEFNSATLYRYAVLDVGKLLNNLQGDRELLLAAIHAYTQAVVRAIPTGKQNSFAAHNAPEFVGICLRHGTPLSLANAFQKPISTRRNDDSLTALSVAALMQYEGKQSAAYGDPQDRWLGLDLTGRWPEDKGVLCSSVSALAQQASELVNGSFGG